VSDQLRAARRILVYGVTGSGKTVAAERIGRMTGLPWHAVDDLTWDRPWVPVSLDEQRRRVNEICAQPEWILDAAYGQWLEIPLARVELIVALDYPRWVSLQRLVRRAVARSLDKRPICNGNTESLRYLFSRQSIVLWHFVSFSRKRERISAWMQQPAGPVVMRFTRPAELERWMAGLTRASRL
jgi:adenylate kinase family enzyme